MTLTFITSSMLKINQQPLFPFYLLRKCLCAAATTSSGKYSGDDKNQNSATNCVLSNTTSALCSDTKITDKSKSAAKTACSSSKVVTDCGNMKKNKFSVTFYKKIASPAKKESICSKKTPKEAKTDICNQSKENESVCDTKDAKTASDSKENELYKNTDYFKYNKFSYYDAMLQCKTLREESEKVTK